MLSRCGTFKEMDQNVQQDQSMEPEGARPKIASRPRLSRLAIASFSLSIVGCCAIPAAAAAVMLGFIANERVRRSQGLLRGRNFAITGIVVGCVGIVTSLALQNFAFSMLDGYEAQMRTSVTALLKEGAAPRDGASPAAASVSLFAVDAPGVDATCRENFARAVRERYGALDGISVVSSEPIGSVFEPSFHWEVVFRFDSGNAVSGVVKTRLVPELGAMMPTSRLVKVRLDGGDAQSLQLPAIETNAPTERELPESEDSGSQGS